VFDMRKWMQTPLTRRKPSRNVNGGSSRGKTALEKKQPRAFSRGDCFRVREEPNFAQAAIVGYRRMERDFGLAIRPKN
jgi:hypothetical protein